MHPSIQPTSLWLALTAGFLSLWCWAGHVSQKPRALGEKSRRLPLSPHFMASSAVAFGKPSCRGAEPTGRKLDALGRLIDGMTKVVWACGEGKQWYRLWLELQCIGSGSEI